MLKKLNIIVASLTFLVGFSFFSSSAFAATAAQKAACEGAGLVATSGDCTGDTNSPTVERLISAAVRILSAIVGIASVIVIMIGGFKYVTSNGDSGKVTSAKSTITYALIGLIIAALAQILVVFVLGTTVKPASTVPPPTCVQGNCDYDPDSPGGTGGNGN